MVSLVQKWRDIEAEWARKATSSAIDAARKLITENGVNGRATLSSLSDQEWSVVFFAMMSAWIKTKSQHAVNDGIGYFKHDAILFMHDYFLQPWDAGAVAATLPSLGEMKGVPWNKPLGEWSEEQIVRFTWNAHTMIESALARREEGAEGKIIKRSQRAEREASARNGGPLLSREELSDDEIPF